MIHPSECVILNLADCNNNKLPLINILIGHIQGIALIDTGASVNIIENKLFLKLQKAKLIDEIQDCALNIIGITGDNFFISNCAIINIRIENVNIKSKFYIVNNLGSVQYHVILGNNFLMENKIKIDFETNCISNHKFCASLGDSINHHEINTSEIEYVNIGSCQKKCKIPPNSELMIEVTAKYPQQKSDLVLIQPSKHSFQSEFVISSSINEFNEKGKYWAKVANFTNEVLHLNKGTKLVMIESVSGVHQEAEYVNTTDIEEIDNNLDLFGGKFQLDHLDENQKNAINDLIRKHQGIFAESVKDLTGCDTIKHRVYLTDDIPIRSKPYRTPYALRDEMKQQVNSLLDAGIISVSDSPYASPVLLVKKKNNSYRLVCDYRKLNIKTQPLPYPLPLISDLLDTLEGAQFYSCLDLCSGYWQMHLDPRDRHKTAFCTEVGLFQWNRLPQGLRNAASSFQRLLEIVLAGLKDFNINTYIDDLIIASKTFEEHIEKLDLVFTRLNRHNLKINPSKCQLAQSQINYLGFNIKNGRIFPEDKNLLAVKNFPVPKNKKNVKQFLGLCNFYRKFVKGFANKALPLTNLTKNKYAFNWTDECQAAFDALKKDLIQSPCLIIPNVKNDFILHTDASGFAIGAVLSQYDENGDLHPVGYASRSLKDAETRYSVFEKELLAIVWGIGNFRQYLYGRQFTLFCDQQSLSRALDLKECGRVTRWALTLQNYDFTIKHTPGKDNIPADVLSRAVNVAQIENSVTSLQSLSNEKLAELQQSDSKCSEIINLLANQNSITIGKTTFFLNNKVLYCHQNSKSKFNIKDKLVVPKTLIPEILNLAHDVPTSAHPGFMRTLNKIRKNYFWHNMRNHILNYIKSCLSCVERRGFKKHHKAPLQRMPIPSRPFEMVGLDAVGPLPVTLEGNKYILVMSDYFSRWVEGYAVKNISTETVAATLEKFISTHGVPEHLITDRGTSFISGAIQAVYKKLNINKHTTTAYHPSSDGVVERANGIIINALKHLVTTTDYEWDKYLNFALMAYRTSFHSSIQDIPAHIVYGRDLTLPIDLLTSKKKFSYADHREYSEDIEIRLQQAFEIIKQNLEKAAEKQENFRNRSAKDKKILVGDLVFLHTPVIKPGESKKFKSLNKGPYRVKQKTSPVNFQIAHINNHKDIQIVHVDRLTKIEERLTFPSLFESEGNNINSQQIEENLNEQSKLNNDNTSENQNKIQNYPIFPKMYTHTVRMVENSKRKNKNRDVRSNPTKIKDSKITSQNLPVNDAILNQNNTSGDSYLVELDNSHDRVNTNTQNKSKFNTLQTGTSNTNSSSNSSEVGISPLASSESKGIQTRSMNCKRNLNKKPENGEKINSLKNHGYNLRSRK